MGSMKPKPRVPARYWTDAQLCERMNCSRGWFATHKEILYRAGMPMPDPVMGNKTDKRAFEAWCDRRSGLVASLPRPHAQLGDPASDRVVALYGNGRA